MKILIIKTSSMGDIIHSNPTLTALRKLYPSAKIFWLIFDIWSDILDLFPQVDEKIVWNRKSGFKLKELIRIIRKVRQEKFDLIIDLQGLLKTALIPFFSGAKKKLGVPGMKELSWLFYKEVFPEKRSMNSVFRSLEVVRFLSSRNFEPKFNILINDNIKQKASDILKEEGINDSDQLIGIAPLTRGKAKQWPIKYFEQLIRMINSNYPNYKVIILGDKKAPLDFSNNNNVVDLSQKTDLKTLAAILSKCCIVVGPDTGPVHLASALGIPVVAIFGGSDVKETSPIAKNASILSHDFQCSPCRKRPLCKNIDCLIDIKPEEVLKAVEKWIK
ncbi:MAG: lipopolysaccharide heptosyltransferase II [Elusimicrobia bacterium]|nr:lipopolysaccharide heptosyltransferase II [Elusimicrobiota bacterium]